MSSDWRAALEHLGPGILKQAGALQARVPPDVFEAILDLMEASEERLSEHWGAQFERQWQQAVVHAPGLGPLLMLLHDHINDPRFGLHHIGCPYVAAYSDRYLPGPPLAGPAYSTPRTKITSRSRKSTASTNQLTARQAPD
jgi:hypothetical protein